RLLNLQEALRKKYGVEVLALNFDIRNRDLTLNELSNLPKEFANVDVLVNNAGLALGLSSIDEGDVDEWEQMIDTNVKGMLYAIRAIAPGMRARKSGHIINIGSTAGKEAYKNGNVYCATKHAVEAITKGTRADLLPYNVKVTSVCPGMAETEFSEVRFSGDTNRAKQVYQGFEPLRPEDIAEVVYFAATRPAHVCLNDVILTPTAQANSFYTERNN
ncbi:MAG TPA: SDR family NAD(P)-dependent oxidoreductase, partial [Flavobacteriales bacterium]|nr:SDR family NAD(P)-dependent oxidoreductase [Flavobacteriales bacterium]